MAIAQVNKRALRAEADWLPKDATEALLVRRVLLEAGHPNQVANGIMAWLLTKAAGEEDGMNSLTRSRYRKVLASLKSPLRSSLRSDTSVHEQLVPTTVRAA